jgi:hypothetical protein
MLTGILLILVACVPLLMLAGWILQLACRLGGAEVPRLAACVGWACFMGGAANGGAAAVRNQIAPSLGEGATLEAFLLQTACYVLIPFFVLRLFVIEETPTALRVHTLNLVLTAGLAGVAFVLFQELGPGGT